MKKLSIKKGVQCMACLECVRACSNAYYKEFHPDKAALKIVQRGENVRPMVCVQCGKCAEACPSGAITQNPKGVWMISRKLCTGCGKCAAKCPAHGWSLTSPTPRPTGMYAFYLPKTATVRCMRSNSIPPKSWIPRCFKKSLPKRKRQ